MQSVTWESSDDTVALVVTEKPNYCLVKAMNPGSATIKATANDGSGVFATSTVKVGVVSNSIRFSPDTITVFQGKTHQLAAIFDPANTSNKNLTWESNTPAVATVSTSGLVTGVSPGTAVINARTQDGSGANANCTINVRIPVNSINLSTNAINMEMGKTANINATISPNDASNQALTWTSSVPAIATVSETGVVTGVSPGSTTITAKAQDGSRVTAQCAVTVFPKIADFTYLELPDGTIRVTGYTGSAAEVQVPAEIIGKKVTEIGDGAFSGKDGITKVNLPSGIRAINSHAFTGSSISSINLTSLSLPGSLTSIGKYAFLGTSLTNIILPGGMASLGDGAFQNCNKLTAITIPDSVTQLGEGVFVNCTSLTRATLPSGLTSIPRRLFWKCRALTSVNLPIGVVSIGEEAFSECFALGNIIIPKGVTSIGFATFWGCQSFTSLSLPAGLTAIGEKAFRNCTGLTSVTIPGKVQSIASMAFSLCPSLKTITIRSNVTSFGTDVFQESPVTILGDVPSAAKDYATANSIPFVNLADGLPGDADGSGLVELKDLVSLVNYLVKGTQCPRMDNADADQSGGNPNIKDLVFIRQLLVQ